MKHLIAGLVISATVWPGAASAHWQYTRWGMTPEKVQSAAKGKLSPVAGQDGCPSCSSVPLLAGDYSAGGQQFRVVFGFTDGKLSQVILAIPATSRTWGCNELYDRLSQNYGAPVSHAPLTGDGTLPNSRWLDPKQDNTVAFNDTSQQNGMCEILYSPIPTGKGL